MTAESGVEKVGREALRRASKGPVDFALLQGLATEHSIPLQRLLSFMDVVSHGACSIDYEAKQVDCHEWQGV